MTRQAVEVLLAHLEHDNPRNSKTSLPGCDPGAVLILGTMFVVARLLVRLVRRR